MPLYDKYCYKLNSGELYGNTNSARVTSNIAATVYEWNVTDSDGDVGTMSQNVPEMVAFTPEYALFRKQLGGGLVQEIRCVCKVSFTVRGRTHSNYMLGLPAYSTYAESNYHGPGVGSSAYTATDNPTLGRFVIPLELLNKLKYKEYVIVYEKCLVMVAYAEQTVYVKWYQTGLTMWMIMAVAMYFGGYQLTTVQALAVANLTWSELVVMALTYIGKAYIIRLTVESIVTHVGGFAGAFLATVASASPYVGLFGTVWGIMNSFRGLAETNQATLSTVAPGISEALIATAIGLFAAIPALIAYNRYTTSVETLLSSFENFMDEFSIVLHIYIYKNLFKEG
jgi:hypothetical protein